MSIFTKRIVQGKFISFKGNLFLRSTIKDNFRGGEGVLDNQYGRYLYVDYVHVVFAVGLVWDEK